MPIVPIPTPQLASPPLSDCHRILDANLNRAREALRVMEDIARFVLSSGALAAELKASRHDLRRLAELARLDPVGMAAWRDTPGDVGTGTTTDAETQRRGLLDVAIAAGKRAGEALRVIEECVKTLPAPTSLPPTTSTEPRDDPASLAKSLRYRVYDQERRLLLALGTSGGHLRQWRLCVLITESQCAGRPWMQIAAQALRGGADCLQLREKDLSDRELLSRAKQLIDVCRAHGGACIVNDRADIAILSGADGVHLGQDDLRVADVRRMAGRGLIVGVSTANMTQALQAAEDGADYCGCGPMFPSTTKAKPTLSGPEYLRQYLANERTARLPHLAISGITRENVGALTAVGCRGVAVSSAVCGAPDPEAAAREIVAKLAV